MSPEDIDIMSSFLDDDTLVVGPTLPGHEFSEGEQALRGRTCPWNTAAIWNVSKLALIGFPLVGDGVVVSPGALSSGGVEVILPVCSCQN